MSDDPILLYNVNAPSAVLELPALFSLNASEPIAVFLIPEVFESNVLTPIAVLLYPAVIDNALAPNAVLVAIPPFPLL